MEATRRRMEDILNTITSAIGGFFANPIVGASIQAFAFYIVILWLAAAYWAFRDMQLRSENPILPYVAAALIVLFTPVLFLFGIIVYRIVRPHEKIAEVYERNLAEEALLAEVEAIKTCPSCKRRINDEWIICPTCRTQLNRVCANCGRLVGLDWALCAWCGREFERPNLAAFQPISAAVPERIEPGAAPSSAAMRSGQRSGSARQSSPSSTRRSAPGSIPEP
jgi:RNA polymerase subunit RPABC4/transcription elongation factor Spt4